ncbi:MAG: 3-oxoacyl-[acyl-carrier-protein] reductase FabG [Candidatus Moanabacter tarae]|uniref:3-oxoacyl-[acyl-carrier-protein] reductase FabG n=1 Tax=Candidatus Moanibacter tarae TaxID=2200854 RepID=A0A2Z4ADI4_9BACT|nr:MAG: 3-oxoacyl-[acyl-carrier-protein] reductase FabG [Candidatus Moanabacter tarae]
MTPDLSSSCHLNGSIAVVTGAAQGLGLGIVEKLARSGATAIIADLQEATARVEAEKLRTQGLSVDAAYLDVTDSTAVRTFFTDLVAQHGHLDILVNNAGVGQKVDPIVETTDQEWDRVISATLTSAFYCSRAAGGIMEDQESGCIVNISSINGQNPAALVGAYNVAKAGIISLTQTLAIELAAYSVRVNAICPGPVYTDFNKSNMAQRCQTLNITEEEMIERIRSAIPLGRWGEPIDIAQAVAFLCSAAASWITGEVLRVSGGLAGVSATPPKRIKTR